MYKAHDTQHIQLQISHLYLPGVVIQYATFQACCQSWYCYEYRYKNEHYPLWSMSFMKLVIPLHSLYWSIHTRDESKRGTAFAFIFGVNWLWRCGVTALFGVFFYEIKCNGMTSFMEFMLGQFAWQNDQFHGFHKWPLNCSICCSLKSNLCGWEWRTKPDVWRKPTLQHKEHFLALQMKWQAKSLDSPKVRFFLIWLSWYVAEIFIYGRESTVMNFCYILLIFSCLSY